MVMKPNPIRDFCPDPAAFAVQWLGDEWVDGFRARSFRFQSAFTKSGPVLTFGRVGYPGDPVDAGKAPAILHIHGGGQTCSTENILYHVKRGYVCMSFDWTGPVEGRKNEEITHYPEDVETNMEQANCEKVIQNGIENNRLVLAAQSARSCLALLASLPEVDAERIGFYGISWGGFMTWLVNGTDTSAKCAVAIYGTGGLHWPGHLANRTWNQASLEAKNLWCQVLEPRAYMTSQHAPLFHVNGSNDFFGGIDVASEMMPMVHNDWRCDFTPNCNHHFDQYSANSVCLWFDRHLRDGEPMQPTPELAVERVGNGRILVKAKGDSQACSLYHSSGDASHLNRCWCETQDWVEEDGELTMELAMNGNMWLFLRQFDHSRKASVCSVPVRVFTLSPSSADSKILFDPAEFPHGWGNQMGTEILHSEHKSYEISKKGLAIVTETPEFSGILCHAVSDAKRTARKEYSRICVEIEGFEAFNVACGVGEPASRNEWYLFSNEKPGNGLLAINKVDFKANDGEVLDSFERIGRLMFSGRSQADKTALIRKIYWE